MFEKVQKIDYIISHRPTKILLDLDFKGSIPRKKYHPVFTE